MGIAPMDIPVTEQLLMVVPWLDPVVDSVGYDVRSQYVELFWLNVLGPTNIALGPSWTVGLRHVFVVT
jgi:hypothetical protein